MHVLIHYYQHQHVICKIIQRDDGYRSSFCSYLQMRGSIPTYWYQETSVTMPKPPILLNRVDPEYQATEVSSSSGSVSNNIYC